MKKNGFTLIELMVVVVIITILAMLAYPSYVGFIRKADRADAKTELLDWANRQHVWRADHPDYNSAINPADTEDYEFTMVSTATSFTLTATAIGNQVDDAEEGISCSSLTLRQDGIPGPTGLEKCWGK